VTVPGPQGKQIKLLWLAVAALILLNVGTLVYFLGNIEPNPHAEDVPRTDIPVAELLKPGPLQEMVMGDPNAPNVIVEYASMTCPHCAAFHEKLLPELKSKFVDTGKVRFVFREFPMDNLAAAAFMLARCSGKEKYFPTVEVLFKTQKTWAKVGGDAKPMLLQALNEVGGFTPESFDKCLEDKKLFNDINAVRKRANEEFKVSSTPSFFVNGKPLVHPESVEEFEALLK